MQILTSEIWCDLISHLVDFE